MYCAPCSFQRSIELLAGRTLTESAGTVEFRSQGIALPGTALDQRFADGFLGTGIDAGGIEVSAAGR